jgi:hypothetical protein
MALFFINKRQFGTMIHPVLPLHECADPAPAESATEPLHSVADSTTAKEVAADPAAVESAIEPLHSATDPAGSCASLTETFCLCVRFWILSIT